MILLYLIISHFAIGIAHFFSFLPFAQKTKVRFIEIAQGEQKMFWENFILLCNKKGESPNSIAKKIGISSGTITNWKNGVQPRPSSVKKLSEYFGVAVDYLLGKEKSPTEEDEQMSEFAKLFPQLSEDEQRLVIAQMKGIIDMKEKK